MQRSYVNKVKITEITETPSKQSELCMHPKFVMDGMPVIATGPHAQHVEVSLPLIHYVAGLVIQSLDLCKVRG